jgi:hypothetical protein
MADSNGSFIRWQGIAITQMGYAVNLFLAFATASLGFALTLFKDPSLKQHCWGRCWVVLAGVALMISIAIGVWCVLNRLRDFRDSGQIARKREGWINKGYAKTWIDDRLRHRRSRSRCRGKRSHQLLHWQIGTFGVGTAFLVLAVVAPYSGV